MSAIPDDQPGTEGSWMGENRCGGCQWLGAFTICRGDDDPRCCMGPKPPTPPRCPTCGQASR